MAPEPTDLAGITRATLEHYNRQAEQFRVGTDPTHTGRARQAMLARTPLRRRERTARYTEAPDDAGH